MKHLFALAVLTAGLATTSLGACGALFQKGPHVPGEYQGTTQITVANASTREMCALMLFTDTASADNWLGNGSKQQNLAPGATRTFAIKPGIYHVIGGFCVGKQVLGAFGTYGAETATIEGPTLLAFGPDPVPAVEGSATVAFTELHMVGDGGGGQTAAEEPAADDPTAEANPSESSASSESSESSAPSSSQPAPAGAACKGDGAEVNGYHECCSGKTTLARRDANNTKTVCCSGGNNCS